MRINDFMKRVGSDAERTFRVHQRKIPAEMLAKIHQGGGVPLAELLAVRTPQTELRQVCYRHILGPPATEAGIAGWRTKRPAHPLPDDLLALVRRLNGIHLWADAQTGRAGTGLAPIEEWDIARFKMHGPQARPSPHLDDRYVAISYDVDGLLRRRPTGARSGGRRDRMGRCKQR